MEKDRYCVNCEFWLSRDGKNGECHESPHAVSRGSEVAMAFPPISADGWCGRFIEKIVVPIASALPGKKR